MSSDDEQPVVKQRLKSKPVISAAADRADNILSLDTANAEDVPLSVRHGPVKIHGKPVVKEERLQAEKHDRSNSNSASDVPLKKRREKVELPAKVNSDEGHRVAEKASRLHKINENSDSDVPVKSVSKKKARKASQVGSETVNGTKHAKNNNSHASKKPKLERVNEDSSRAASITKKTKQGTRPKIDGNNCSKELMSESAKASDSDKIKEEDSEQYKWWENIGDGPKWTTLEHNGVLLAPPYEPLPKHIKMKYGGESIQLAPEAEEVAGFFGAMLETDHAQKPVFISNFFEDFREIIKKSGGAKNTFGKTVKIDKFEKCDFRPMFDYFEAKKEERKNISKEQKKALKDAKDEVEAKYMYCLLDGRKEKVGNFRVEPPGLFRGRGDHPKTGRLKTRVQPEQITINIGPDVPVPAPPEGHSWQAVQHDDKVTWLAMWKENINSNIKYVFLAANSSLKGQSDYRKFEKSRELQKHIDAIRKNYTKELKDEMMVNRQRATAMYLIDIFALRAGGEKGEDEADTVGCCSLRFEHVTLKPPSTVIFDFLGKDSIRYYNQVNVSPQVFKNLKIFKKAPKTKGDLLFDRLSVTALNKHLQDYMPGLSAKVFRTYNASYTMQKEIDKLENKGSAADKLLAYNRANRTVAILCNHQRSVSKGHGNAMEKITYKILGAKYQKLQVKRAIRALDPKRYKKDSAFFEPDSDLDDETVEEVQRRLVAKHRESIRKKFEKENLKLEAEGGQPQPEKELESRLTAADEMAKEFSKENKTGMVEPRGSATMEKLENQLVKLDDRIKVAKNQQTDRDEGKAIALGTSKLNYIDPRLTVMFSKRFDVPIEKLFPKTMRDKFAWAIEQADENWMF